MLANSIALWILAGLWCILGLLLIESLRHVRDLPALRSTGRDESPCRPVSIVVTARNEEARIATTVRRLLRQRHIEVEVIVVDDRSTDGTAQILKELKAERSQIRVLRIDELPTGWLGKNHACHRGAAEARGNWLLFTDADAWMGDELVARAVQAARDTRADHVCLLPSEQDVTLAARAGLLPFATPALAIAGWVNRDRYRGPIGVGAFNLVRTEAYRDVGGHLAIPLQIIDDAELGRLLLRGRFRTRVFAAPDALEIRWARTLVDLFRALEKNLFAAVGFRPLLAFAALVVAVVPWAVTWIGALSGQIAGFAALGAMLSLVVPATLAARRTRSGVASGLLAPLMLPFPGLVLAWSGWTVLRRGGVLWRGTFYPLALLRRQPPLP